MMKKTSFKWVRKYKVQNLKQSLHDWPLSSTGGQFFHSLEQKAVSAAFAQSAFTLQTEAGTEAHILPQAVLEFLLLLPTCSPATLVL